MYLPPDVQIEEPTHADSRTETRVWKEEGRGPAPNLQIELLRRADRIGWGWGFQDEGVPEMFNVGDIEVLREERGKGIGRYLLQRMIWESKKLGYQTSSLQTGRSNHVAQLLYFGMGFQAIHTSYSYSNPLV